MFWGWGKISNLFISNYNAMISRIERNLEKHMKAVLVILAFVSLISYLVTLVFYILTFHAKPISGEPSDWGLFGDYIGGVLNPFFAFMALIALIMTLHIQWREAKESKKDAERISVEGRFFQMLGLHHAIVNELKIYKDDGDILVSGRACFKVICSKVDSIKLMFPGLGRERDFIVDEWKKIYDIYSYCLGHYFHNLECVFLYIDGLKDEIGEEINNQYIDILRAQLSVYEVLLLFFYSLSDDGAGFVALIEKYSLLKQLPIKELKRFGDYLYLYEISAYGDLPIKYLDICFGKREEDERLLAERIKIDDAWKDML